MKKEKENISKADVEWNNSDEGVLTEYEYTNLLDGEEWQGHRTIQSKYIIKSDVCAEQLKNLNLSLKNVGNQIIDTEKKISDLGSITSLTKEENRIREIVLKVGKNEESVKLTQSLVGMNEQKKRYEEMLKRVQGYINKLPENETAR